MEIRSQLEIAAWLACSYLFVRMLARFFKRWPKTVAAIFSLVTMGAAVAAYAVKQSQFDAAILVVCGLVAGTLECWVRIWRESTKTKWVRAE